MKTKAAMEPSGSPVPGVIPEPVRVHNDPAPPQSPIRRNLASRAWTRMWSALHGDKYLVGAYPPEWQPRAGAPPAHPGPPQRRPHHSQVR
jgi:hypothetical protein